MQTVKPQTCDDGIMRDMTNAEIAQIELDKTEAKKLADAKTAKDVARQAVLEKLGLTADEAQALLG